MSIYNTYIYVSSTIFFIHPHNIFLGDLFQNVTSINNFLYARHLTDVLWYGTVCTSVRPSVRNVLHNPCGQDIARTIWPRMLKLSVYSLCGHRMKPIYFQGQRSNFKVTGPLQRILALGSLWAGYSKNYTA